jgi:predicted  nucleic acid-binding Zn-ribbon protein
MKATFLTWCLAVGCLFAQEATPLDLEARRESVATLKTHLEMREKRFEEVAAEIRQRGQTTNEKISELVKMLAGLKDSESSKRRISQVKGEAIAGLKRMIEIYQTERRTIVERLRGDSSVPTEALKKDMEAIDALVEKRVAEILELVKSMPGGEDISKYESDGDSYYNGVHYENSRVSEAWRQNRRDRVESEKQRHEVQQALEKAIADLGRRADTLKSALSGGKLTAPETEIYQHELAHVTELTGQRKAQLLDVTVPSTAEGEQAASKGESDDLKHLFNDARRDISSDFSKTLRLYHAAATEREKIHALKENLTAREKWLSENDPDSKKPE